jgi:hypothetical protein
VRTCTGFQCQAPRKFPIEGTAKRLCDSDEDCQAKCCENTCAHHRAEGGCGAPGKEAVPGSDALQCSTSADCERKCCFETTCTTFLQKARCPAKTVSMSKHLAPKTPCAGHADCEKKCCKQTCASLLAEEGCPEKQVPAVQQQSKKGGSSKKQTQRLNKRVADFESRECESVEKCREVCCVSAQSCSDFWKAEGCGKGMTQTQDADDDTCASAADCRAKCCRKPALTCGAFLQGKGACPAGALPREGVAPEEPCGDAARCRAKCCSHMTCGKFLRDAGCAKGFTPLKDAADVKCDSEADCTRSCCHRPEAPLTCSRWLDKSKCGEERKVVSARLGTRCADDDECSALCCAERTCEDFFIQNVCGEPTPSPQQKQRGMMLSTVLRVQTPDEFEGEEEEEEEEVGEGTEQTDEAEESAEESSADALADDDFFRGFSLSLLEKQQNVKHRQRRTAALRTKPCGSDATCRDVCCPTRPQPQPPRVPTNTSLSDTCAHVLSLQGCPHGSAPHRDRLNATCFGVECFEVCCGDCHAACTRCGSQCHEACPSVCDGEVPQLPTPCDACSAANSCDHHCSGCGHCGAAEEPDEVEVARL